MGGKIPKKGVPERVKNEHLTPFIKLGTFWVFALCAQTMTNILTLICSWNSGFFSLESMMKRHRSREHKKPKRIEMTVHGAFLSHKLCLSHSVVSLLYLF